MGNGWRSLVGSHEVARRPIQFSNYRSALGLLARRSSRRASRLLLQRNRAYYTIFCFLADWQNRDERRSGNQMRERIAGIISASSVENAKHFFPRQFNEAPT